MLRFIGASLVALCGAWAGIQAAQGLGQRVRYLRDLEAGLALLQRELEHGGLPLPMLMQQLSQRSDTSARAIFQGCAKGLTRLEQECFADGWKKLVDQRHELGEEGQACLYPLGDTLGRYDSREQGRAVAGVRRRLEQIIEQAQADHRRKGRVYRALGLSGGAFLIILLL